MSVTDQITPLDAVDPADWYAPTPHVRVYRPDQRWRVAVNMSTGNASVFSGSVLFQRVFLARGPSGGLVPVSDNEQRQGRHALVCGRGALRPCGRTGPRYGRTRP